MSLRNPVLNIHAMRRGVVKRIHVNQHIVKANRKSGEREPVITIQTSKGPFTAKDIKIHGSSKVIYSPDKPLKCGATIWVETKAPITVIQ